MRLLLDTNVLIWLVSGNSRAADLVPEIEDLSNEIYFSSASVWEIAIKNQIGKLNIDPSDAAEEFRKAGFAELKISSKHAAAIAGISLREDHKDPFDRLLIAQAMAEDLILVTGDSKIAGYSEAKIMLI